ncbi:MAG: hypothetical protein Q8R15_00535 [Candidatus Micrarchaeota archaeon]|nr:hypothetical protein [Candidatus Micrarchaeota archaeon]
MIFEEHYHPNKAVRKEAHGAFDVYYFNNGASLTVRRKHTGVLFSPGKLTYRPIHTAEGEHSRILDAYEGDKIHFLVRIESRQHFAPTYDGLLHHYSKLYAARVRIEAPVAWLNESLSNRKNAIIVTKYRKTWTPLYNKLLQIRDSIGGETSIHQRRKKIRGIFEKVFYELGKMHGAGVRHGHPHDNNILVDGDGNVAFTDPKLLGDVNDVPKNIPLGLGRKLEFFPSHGKGADADLSRLTGIINSRRLENWLNWSELGKAYEKGVALGKKRTAHLQ